MPTLPPGGFGPGPGISVAPQPPALQGPSVGPIPAKTPVLSNTPGGSTNPQFGGTTLLADSNANAESKSSRYRPPEPSGDSSNSMMPVSSIPGPPPLASIPVAPVAPVGINLPPPAPPQAAPPPDSTGSPSTLRPALQPPAPESIASIAVQAKRDSSKEDATKESLKKRAQVAAAGVKDKRQSLKKQALDTSKIPVDQISRPAGARLRQSIPVVSLSASSGNSNTRILRSDSNLEIARSGQSSAESQNNSQTESTRVNQPVRARGGR